MISPKIIFENNDFLIIDKPSGLVVNRAETQKGETIEDWAAQKVTGVERSGIVHRLDKDTSGLLVIAKTTEVWEKLKAQFKNREVTKKYLTLVHGELYLAVGTVNAPIDRNPFNRMHYGIFPGGREAVTQYKTVQKYKSLTLLEVTPKTGRTHQIRVHMKYLNHPVVSDPIYGGRKNYQNDLKFCPRLFLHATYLKIDNLEFNSPLPAELQTVLDQLQ